MKVYQCIHKYNPHISYFEEKYKPVQNDLSFNEWRNLLIEDGFASCNILQPTLGSNTDEVFYTLWDYENLQLRWARENGLKTKNLDEIKLAQIEEFAPDVFYNISPNYDGNFVRKLQHKNKLVRICWDAIITYNPPFHENYHARLTLFEPYVKFWKQHGFNSYLFPPAFPASWEKLNRKHKDIDILFYGQYNDYFFSERNKLIKEIITWSKQKELNFQLYLQLPKQNKPLIDIRGVRTFTRWMPAAPGIISKNALSPIYGQQLYETIARSKIVVNSFTNYNGLFKDNMRNYESIGCGAFLISEEGIYPDYFSQNTDFYTYRSASELFDKIKQFLSLPDQGLHLTDTTREKLKTIYSKENQWKNFLNVVNSISVPD